MILSSSWKEVKRRRRKKIPPKMTSKKDHEDESNEDPMQMIFARLAASEQQQLLLREQLEQLNTGGEPPMEAACNHGQYRVRNYLQPPQLEINYELKSHFLSQLSQFHGNATEESYEFLRDLELICSHLRYSQVRQDYIRLTALHFTLKGKADYWVKNLEVTVTTYDRFKNLFLKKFYPLSRTNQMRARITSFSQMPNEPLCDAWDTFNDLLQKCHCHNLDNNIIV